MKKVFVSYGDNNFKRSKRRIKREAISSGWFDYIEIFSPEKLTSDFRATFSSILSYPRGAGYWIWKLDVLEQAFSAISEGDIVVYLDSGCHINHLGAKRFGDYIEMLRYSEFGFISFQLPHLEKEYTTKECFDALRIPNDSEIRDSGQINATALISKKCDHALAVVADFRRVLTLDPLIITDFYNKSQNTFFIDHRHDQSLLSILRKTHGSLLLQDETYFPIFANPKSNLATKLIFKLHRKFESPLLDKAYFARFYSSESSASPFWALRYRI